MWTGPDGLLLDSILEAVLTKRSLHGSVYSGSFKMLSYISHKDRQQSNISLWLHWCKTVRKEGDPPPLTHPHLQSSNKNLKKDPMAWLISPASSKLGVSDFKGTVDLACIEDTLFRK